MAILHSALVIYSLKMHIHLTCKNQIKRTSGKYQKACERENWYQKACKLENKYQKACELESWYQQPCKLGIGIRGLEALKLVYQKLGRLQFVYQKLGSSMELVPEAQKLRSLKIYFRSLELVSEAEKLGICIRKLGILEPRNWCQKLGSLKLVYQKLRILELVFKTRNTT